MSDNPRFGLVTHDDCNACQNLKSRLGDRLGREVKEFNLEEEFDLIRELELYAVPACVVLNNDGRPVRKCSKEEKEEFLSLVE